MNEENHKLLLNNVLEEISHWKSRNESVENLKEKIISVFQNENIMIKEIKPVIDAVCFDFYITESQLKSKKRLRYIADARKIIAYLLRKNTLLTDMQIGKLLNKQHSTISSMESTAKILIKTDKQFSERLSHIEKKIQPELLQLRQLSGIK